VIYAGHGTLSAAHVLFIIRAIKPINSSSIQKAVKLGVERRDWLYLDFLPGRPCPAALPAELLKALVYEPVKVIGFSPGLMVVFHSETIIKKIDSRPWNY